MVQLCDRIWFPGPYQQTSSSESESYQQVTDEAGHTSTTTVSLTILDANDNKPTFATSQNAQFFTITDCASTVGTVLGTISATDQDSTYQG
jgi:hypothetical protein